MKRALKNQQQSFKQLIHQKKKNPKTYFNTYPSRQIKMISVKSCHFLLAALCKKNFFKYVNEVLIFSYQWKVDKLAISVYLSEQTYNHTIWKTDSYKLVL